jgi:predicted  nucleic acid-binding Zn-ribbon protein
MSETQQAEIQHWQARTDDMQVALDRVREERDKARDEITHLLMIIEHGNKEVKQLRSMIDRIQVAMSQGQEL